jgi:hypothetical protein
VSLAKATREQLGYDESVTFVDFNERDGVWKRVFEYKIPGNSQHARRFRTRNLIADRGANILTGRGTRVWEVVEILDGEDEPKSDRASMVLKDSWIDDDRVPEYETLRKVREKLEREGDPGLHHFLNVECASVVQRFDLTPDITNSSVCDLSAVEYLDLWEDLWVKPNSESQACNGASSSPEKSGEPQTEPASKFSNIRDLRKHCRHVVPEFGKPLTRLRSYPVLLEALHGALCGRLKNVVTSVFSDHNSSVVSSCGFASRRVLAPRYQSF